MISKKKYKNLIDNVIILFLIIIILLLIYKYYVKNIESFQNYEGLKNYKDISCLNDIIRDKNITVLGSGKSLEYFKKTDDIVIVVNNTITHDIIPSFNKIIWVFGGIGTKQLYKQYTENTLHKLKRKPDIIIILMFENSKKHNEKLGKFSNYIYNKYPKIILSNYFIDKSMKNRISSGYYSIKLSLNYNPKNIIIAGLDSINGSNQYDKKTFLKHPSYNKIVNATHNLLDKKFINNLSKKDKSKLKPIKECGLYEFLNKK